MSAASGPAAPAKGMPCRPSLFLTPQHSFPCCCYCFWVRHSKAKHYSCFVAFHKAVWHDVESLVSGLSVDNISLAKGILWEQDPSYTQDCSSSLNSYFLTMVSSFLSGTPWFHRVDWPFWWAWSFFLYLGWFLDKGKSYFSSQKSKMPSILTSLRART